MRDIKLQIPTKLEKLFSGVNYSVSYSRTIMCQNCAGSGHENDNIFCLNCNGEGSVRDTNELFVIVRPGTKSGELYTFPGQGNQLRNGNTYDVIIRLSCNAHHTFRRVENDLIITVNLDLVDALSGFKRSITGVDGQQILIRRSPGKPTQCNDVAYVLNHGMPIMEAPLQRGRLIVKFNILNPTNIPSESLRKCLPVQETDIPYTAESVLLNEMDDDSNSMDAYFYSNDDGEYKHVAPEDVFEV